jgi:hypothetical protein
MGIEVEYEEIREICDSNVNFVFNPAKIRRKTRSGYPGTKIHSVYSAPGATPRMFSVSDN